MFSKTMQLDVTRSKSLLECSQTLHIFVVSQQLLYMFDDEDNVIDDTIRLELMMMQVDGQAMASHLWYLDEEEWFDFSFHEMDVLEFSPSMVVRFYISSIPHVT